MDKEIQFINEILDKGDNASKSELKRAFTLISKDEVTRELEKQMGKVFVKSMGAELSSRLGKKA